MTSTEPKEPKELELQKYLRRGDNVVSREQQFAGLSDIHVKIHKQYPNLHLFKYANLAADFTNEITCECRGVILDADDNWNVISLPYYKFFNWGEPLQATIDLDSARLYAKEDGSLMTLYYYKGEWHVSSSGSPDASGSVGTVKGAGVLTFRDLFWRVFKESGYTLPTDTDKVFIFELLTSMNQVVVPQNTSRLVLHGVRCMKSLEEIHPELFKDQFTIVQEFPFSTIQDVLDTAKVLPAAESEGFILVDSAFQRVKIKGIEYVGLAHRQSKLHTFTDADVLDVVLKKEQSELLVAFPELSLRVQAMEALYKRIVDRVFDFYSAVSEKTTAEVGRSGVLKNKWYAPLIFDLLRDDSFLERLAKMGGKKVYAHISEQPDFFDEME